MSVALDVLLAAERVLERVFAEDQVDRHRSGPKGGQFAPKGGAEGSYGRSKFGNTLTERPVPRPKAPPRKPPRRPGERPPRKPPAGREKTTKTGTRREPPMRHGDRGPRVRALQELLSLLGLETEPDGILGDHTEAQIREAQRKLGLRETGKASKALLRRMSDAAKLSPCVGTRESHDTRLADAVDALDLAAASAVEVLRVAEANYYNVRHGKGTGDVAGQFRRLDDMVAAAIKDWLSGDAKDADPLDEFDPRQLKAVMGRMAADARKRGDTSRADRLTPPIRSSKSELKLRLYADAKVDAGSGRDIPVAGVKKPAKKATPATKKAVPEKAAKKPAPKGTTDRPEAPTKPSAKKKAGTDSFDGRPRSWWLGQAAAERRVGGDDPLLTIPSGTPTHEIARRVSEYQARRAAVDHWAIQYGGAGLFGSTGLLKPGDSHYNVATGRVELVPTREEFVEKAMRQFEAEFDAKLAAEKKAVPAKKAAKPAAKKAAPKKAAERPSGLPRKPVSGDFDDLAERVTGRSEERIREVLDDLNATELTKLARKFPGGVGLRPGKQQSTDRSVGLRIPDGLTLEQRREWLAWQLSGRARRDPSNPPEFMRERAEAETAAKEREREKAAPKTPDQLAERLAANTSDPVTRTDILNVGPNPTRLRELADEVDRDADAARDPLDGRRLRLRAEYLREAADEIEAFAPPAKATTKAPAAKAAPETPDVPEDPAFASTRPGKAEIKLDRAMGERMPTLTRVVPDHDASNPARVEQPKGKWKPSKTGRTGSMTFTADEGVYEANDRYGRKWYIVVDGEAREVSEEEAGYAALHGVRATPSAGRPKAPSPDPSERGSRARGREVLAATSDMLRQQVDSRGYIDVGAGVERHLGISRARLDQAIKTLKADGYAVHSVQIAQLGGKGKTTVKVLAPPGTSYRDVDANKSKIGSVVAFSDDRGQTYEPIRAPLSVDSSRLEIRYAEDGGADADGVVYVRPGVADLSLGGGRYAQVRIAVDDTHYIKGMAVYRDDLPDGVDLVFHTKKKRTAKKTDVLKPLKRDPETGEVDLDDPFGTTIRRQILEDDGQGGKRVVSAMNLVYEEGSWSRWSNSLSSQVLSKQSPDLARAQLGVTRERRRRELDDILAIEQPVVRRELLREFAEGTDSAAVDLAAAALPRQAWHVILPVGSLPETEVYAPGYRNGERVVLIRHPHGGTFEIPDLVVNNDNPEARRLLGDASDAVGIHPAVAARLSGADFDGDTVLVVPHQGEITTSPPLAGLADFDPIESYPATPGMTPMSAATEQTQMGVVSNLITDMTIQGASPDEIVRAVRHSMVVIDARKHKLDYRRSALDHGIAELRRKYQGGGGAATLVSKASSETDVPARRPRPAAEGGPIDPATGRLVFDEPETWVDAEGRTRTRTRKAARLAVTPDARTLISAADTEIERIYAEHSNELKAMADEARREMVGIGNVRWDPEAKSAHAEQVATLRAKLDIALKNAPVERQAQIIANAIVERKMRATEGMSKAEQAKYRKRIAARALKEARERVGAGKTRIHITDEEWEAIQAGALSDDLLTKILANADPARVRALARAEAA